MKTSGGAARRLVSHTAIYLACLAAFEAHAQSICSVPIVVSDTQCTVTPGTTLTAGASQTGVSASGATGVVTANGITINLTGAGATGAFAQNGALVTTDNTLVDTTATTAATIVNQFGLRAIGSGSRITGTLTQILIGPPASGAANNLHGVSAEGGASIELTDATVSALGGANSLDSNAVQATGAQSRVALTRGTLQTASRGAFGAAALDGGAVTLTGTTVTTTGVQNVTTLQGSHALYANGSNSRVTATGVNVLVSGTLANAFRADNRGVVEAIGSTLATTASGTAADPAAVARAATGGRVLISQRSKMSGRGQ